MVHSEVASCHLHSLELCLLLLSASHEFCFTDSYFPAAFPPAPTLHVCLHNMVCVFPKSV